MWAKVIFIATSCSILKWCMWPSMWAEEKFPQKSKPFKYEMLLKSPKNQCVFIWERKAMEKGMTLISELVGISEWVLLTRARVAHGEAVAEEETKIMPFFAILGDARTQWNIVWKGLTYCSYLCHDKWLKSHTFLELDDTFEVSNIYLSPNVEIFSPTSTTPPVCFSVLGSSWP